MYGVIKIRKSYTQAFIQQGNYKAQSYHAFIMLHFMSFPYSLHLSSLHVSECLEIDSL